MTEKKLKSKEILINYAIPEEITTGYSNNVIVQHTDNEFIISFFEILPPLIVGTPEEKAAQLEKIKEIKANCVARIVIPVGLMQRIIDTLQENLDGYKSKFDDDTEESNE